jgi:thiol-disulfide isomerase/thioredoxin
MRFLLATMLTATCLFADLVQDVRSAIAQNNYDAGERMIGSHEKTLGVTPESILALSWLGRGSQAAKRWDEAERYATSTRALVMEQLKKRRLDAEPNLPLALGASIEVMGQSLAGRGQLSEAVAMLKAELKTWYSTSIRTRIQKNLHVLSLEGKPAPALDTKVTLGGGGPAPTWAQLKGKPVLVFFWAHWCADCKSMSEALIRLQQQYGAKGFTIVGATQRYGYIGGDDATPERETKHIEEIRRAFYGGLQMQVPLSEENFRAYGSSSSPTLVLVDRAGIVRLYHPGKMTYGELEPLVAKYTN